MEALDNTLECWHVCVGALKSASLGDDIEGRSSDRDSPQIDRHPVSPAAVLVATDPNVLNCGSTAIADTASYC